MMNFNLNIAITLYKPDKIELNNYLKSFKEIINLINKKYPKRINNLINFAIISDNPKLEDKKEINEILQEYKKLKNYQYFATDKILEKADIVIKNISKIKAKFIKICDPDDLILPEKMIEIALELDNFTSNCIILHSLKKIKYHYKLIFENIDNLNTWESFTPFSFNTNTIYSVELLNNLKRDHWSFRHSVWSDDAIAIAIAKYDLYYVYLPDFDPYINNPHAGVSTTKKEHNNKEFYNATIDLIKLISKEYKNFNNFFSTDKPNIFFLKSVRDDLFLYKSNRFVKFFKYLWFLILIELKLNRKYNWYKKKKYKFFFLKIYFLFSLLTKSRIILDMHIKE